MVDKPLEIETIQIIGLLLHYWCGGHNRLELRPDGE
jgi:hypothetical protein